MFTRPGNIADTTISDALRDGWALDTVSVEYLPEGFGSHHWVVQAADGQQWFATVDDLASRDFLGSSPSEAFDGLTRAFATAAVLRDAGLEWVVCPSAGIDGKVLRWLHGSFSIAVFPYVRGVTAADYQSDIERTEVMGLLAELHQCTERVVAIARRETFAVPNRTDLEAAIAEVATPWTGGPYAEPARALLGQHLDGVRGRLAAYDQLVQQALRDPSGWTVTHGEPDSRNVLRTDRGMRLIDWDTVLIAPPERDLWMLVATGSDEAAQFYTAATGRAIEDSRLRLYALWWDLCEIAIYITGFRASHTDTEDSAESWRNLQHFIAAYERPPRT